MTKMLLQISDKDEYRLNNYTLKCSVVNSLRYA